MTQELRIGAFGFVLMWLIGCTPGNLEYREAEKAELRKDWDTALVDYEKAAREQPENAKIIIHTKLVRGQATALHYKQGERLLKEGKTDEAAAEFQRAVSIDPTNEAAASELAKVVAAQAAAKKARGHHSRFPGRRNSGRQRGRRSRRRHSRLRPACSRTDLFALAALRG